MAMHASTPTATRTRTWPCWAWPTTASIAGRKCRPEPAHRGSPQSGPLRWRGGLLADHGQGDEAGLAGCVVHALRRLHVVGRLRLEDVGHEGLRIAVVQREPARLHLHHQPVA